MPVRYREHYLPAKSIETTYLEDGSVLIRSTLPMIDMDRHVVSPVMRWSELKPVAAAFAEPGEDGE